MWLNILIKLNLCLAQFSSGFIHSFIFKIPVNVCQRIGNIEYLKSSHNILQDFSWDILRKKDLNCSNSCDNLQQSHFSCDRYLLDFSFCVIFCLYFHGEFHLKIVRKFFKEYASKIFIYYVKRVKRIVVKFAMIFFWDVWRYMYMLPIVK